MSARALVLLCVWLGACSDSVRQPAVPLQPAEIARTDDPNDADAQQGTAAAPQSFDVGRASQAFGTALYRELAKTPSPNLAFSPMSLVFPLALAYGGARGETARELQAPGYLLPG